MRTRLLVMTAALTMVLPLTLGGSALAAGHGPAAGSQAVTASHNANTKPGFVTGPQRFEVYATNFQASFAPIYFTGALTTAGEGYKDFADFQDQAFVPKANGTFVIFHPGLSQTEGVTTRLDKATCELFITGSSPVFFIDGTGGFTGISGKGTVHLHIRVFLRVNSDGSCNQTDPPWGYIEIARGSLIASIPAAVAGKK
jgi:hypothetical protein